MPGFLSAYETPERIILDKERGYWVDVKPCLSSAEYAPVELALGSRHHISATSNGKVQFSDIDQREAQIRMLIAAIVDWNFDEDDGTVWALAPEKAKRANIERMPVWMRMQVYSKCDELNGPPEPAEQATFPDEAGVGDTDGDGGAGGSAGLPDREGVLAAAGPDEGGPAEPPLA
jgi:hypothetical protein